MSLKVRIKESISRNCLFQHIKSLQYYELISTCSHLPFLLALPLTYAVYLSLGIVNVH